MDTGMKNEKSPILIPKNSKSVILKNFCGYSSRQRNVEILPKRKKSLWTCFSGAHHAKFVSASKSNQIPKQVRNEERVSKFGTNPQRRNFPLDGLSSNAVREETQRGDEQNKTILYSLCYKNRSLNTLYTKYLILILLFFSFSFQGKSQLMDSIHVCLQAPPKPMVKLNNRGSFMANKSATVIGLVLGVSFNKRLKFGLGYNQVKSHIYKHYILKDDFGNPEDTFNLTLELSYISGYAEYIYFYTKHWEISIPIQFGAGFSRYYYKTSDKTFYTGNHFGFTYEATTDIVYKPVNWVGFGVGFGYRILLFNEPEILRQFSSPIYSFGIKLYLSPVYRAIFPKNDE